MKQMKLKTLFTGLVAILFFSLSTGCLQGGSGANFNLGDEDLGTDEGGSFPQAIIPTPADQEDMLDPGAINGSGMAMMLSAADDNGVSHAMGYEMDPGYDYVAIENMDTLARLEREESEFRLARSLKKELDVLVDNIFVPAFASSFSVTPNAAGAAPSASASTGTPDICSEEHVVCARIVNGKVEATPLLLDNPSASLSDTFRISYIDPLSGVPLARLGNSVEEQPLEALVYTAHAASSSSLAIDHKTGNLIQVGDDNIVTQINLASGRAYTEGDHTLSQPYKMDDVSDSLEEGPKAQVQLAVAGDMNNNSENRIVALQAERLNAMRPNPNSRAFTSTPDDEMIKHVKVKSMQRPNGAWASKVYFTRKFNPDDPEPAVHIDELQNSQNSVEIADFQGLAQDSNGANVELKEWKAFDIEMKDGEPLNTITLAEDSEGNKRFVGKYKSLNQISVQQMNTGDIVIAGDVLDLSESSPHYFEEAKDLAVLRSQEDETESGMAVLHHDHGLTFINFNLYNNCLAENSGDDELIDNDSGFGGGFGGGASNIPTNDCEDDRGFEILSTIPVPGIIDMSISPDKTAMAVLTQSGEKTSDAQVMLIDLRTRDLMGEESLTEWVAGKEFNFSAKTIKFVSKSHMDRPFLAVGGQSDVKSVLVRKL
jgi:hypothetical protein